MQKTNNKDVIEIKGAYIHNLKNVDLLIPKENLVAITGVSGSGKSSLIFDTLQKECQRQYMESLGMVTDYLSKPKVKSIRGLSPAISVGQNLTSRNPRSTVGTMTEVFTYIRVLFARIGHYPCPRCGINIAPRFETVNQTVELDPELYPEDDEPNDVFNNGITYPCPGCARGLSELTMSHFSFNKPSGACPTCTGLGTIYTANLDQLIDNQRSIRDGAVRTWEDFHKTRYPVVIENASKHYGFRFDGNTAFNKLGAAAKDFILYGAVSPQFIRHYPKTKPPKTVADGRFEGVITNLLRRFSEKAQNSGSRENLDRLIVTQTCPSCMGTRLREESRQVRVVGNNIIEISQFSLQELDEWLRALVNKLPEAELQIAHPILDDLEQRVRRLIDVGVGYLSLDRSAPSLSGGEAQRLRLASLLGSGLTGVLYVLDEPTIGLHPRDTKKMIRVMKKLRDMGNTVVVIEHDMDIIHATDYIIDIGPGAGKFGGEVVAMGTPEQVARNERSVTGTYLTRGSGKYIAPHSAPASSKSNGYLTIRGAREHNLANITLRLPLGKYIAITGVSGSGKSTLVFDILSKAGRSHLYNEMDIPGEHVDTRGWERLTDIITIDQKPIGRTPRSNAATYTDVFTSIRNLFANLPAAKNVGFKAKHFSFNVPGGRCEKCKGAGVLNINMHFLPDVQVRCPMCHGQRFKPDILKITYREKNIAAILELTIDEAINHFAQEEIISNKLKILSQVGLGYLQLGQPATTLSGGEAQRIKLAKELSRSTKGSTLYLLDEPTTGLHPADIDKLNSVLRQLVDQSNTVIVIEHNLDVIACADWIIDLGPGGGDAGGKVVIQGVLEQIMNCADSFTGQALKEKFRSSMPAGIQSQPGQTG